MAIQMQIRRGNLAAWGAASNPILLAGELGFVTDTGLTAFKIGDGSTGWDTLPYVNSTYPELLVTGGTNLDLAVTQGRYKLLDSVTYTNDPTEFTGSTVDGESVLLVTVPSSGIVVQELTTSLTSKRWIRAKNSAAWSTWQRLHGSIPTDSLTVVNLTTTGIISVPDGSAAVPSITNTGDTDTGLYFPAGDNSVGITAIGVLRAQFGNTSSITTPLTITGLTSVTGAIAATMGVSGIGVQAGTSGLSSTGGLAVSGGGSTLAVPLALGNAAAAATNVFSTKNTGGTVVTSIRGDGNPVISTDLTTKSYVDTQVAAVTFREMMIIGVDETDSNYIKEGVVVTGVISTSTTIPVFTSGGGAPTVTSFSNLPSSTVTWSIPTFGLTRRHLVPSAGTWNVVCGGADLNGGASFTAIRTA